MLILGSCLALNLNYSGCCVMFLSPPCTNNGCYCDQTCHTLNDCCNDIADIGCHPASFNSPIASHTPIDTPLVTSGISAHYEFQLMPITSCHNNHIVYVVKS